LFRKEFDSVLDGIVYAAITSLGFAATENVLYMWQYGYAESGWEGIWFMFFLRVVLGAWNHASYTAFTGIGLAAARLNRSTAIKIIAPIAGFSMSVFTHFIHNTLAVFAQGEGGLAMLLVVDWLGWLFIFAIMAWAISRERVWIRYHLRQELQNGLITEDHYRVAISPLKRGFVTLGGLATGKYFSTKKFYQRCAELAYKKQQIARLGSTTGNTPEMVNQLRAEIVHLAPKANT
ncbi:MAG: PrsW family intramembrane metalloprotease, partial [Anaerolineales bacterium]